MSAIITLSTAEHEEKPPTYDGDLPFGNCDLAKNPKTILVASFPGAGAFTVIFTLSQTNK